MAFTAKTLSWRFRHLNIAGCLLKTRPTKGGHGHPRTPPPPPSYTPEIHGLNNRVVILSYLVFVEKILFYDLADCFLIFFIPSGMCESFIQHIFSSATDIVIYYNIVYSLQCF